MLIQTYPGASLLPHSPGSLSLAIRARWDIGSSGMEGKRVPAPESLAPPDSADGARSLSGPLQHTLRPISSHTYSAKPDSSAATLDPTQPTFALATPRSPFLHSTLRTGCSKASDSCIPSTHPRPTLAHLEVPSHPPVGPTPRPSRRHYARPAGRPRRKTSPGEEASLASVVSSVETSQWWCRRLTSSCEKIGRAHV